MKRKNIIIVVLFFVIGFASVTTTFAINGFFNFSFNHEDFDVYFSDVTLNGESRKKEFISNDGKMINFITNDLNIVGDQAIIYYEITNASREYDAEIKLICEDVESEYVSFINILNSPIIEAQTTKGGELFMELLKPTVESLEVNLSCRIEAIPIERDEVANDFEEGSVNTYSLYGYFVNIDGEKIPNADIVVYSPESHYAKTDDRGYFYLDALEKGSHEIYYLTNSENVSEMTKEEIEEAAVSSSVFTTSTSSLTFKDGSTIKGMSIELTNNKSYAITLKTSNDILISDDYFVTQNKPYGNLPKIEVKNSSFINWKLPDGTIINNDTLVADINPHVLIAEISPVVAPVLEGGSDSWKSSDVNIMIKKAGIAEKGIKHYEYLITEDNATPSSEETPTGITNGDLTISNLGVNYIFYRTVALDDVKSSWSSPQTVKIDKSAPSNVNFSNKVVNGSVLTMSVNYIENESGITNIRCLYGDINSQKNLGTSKDGVCEYPSFAEYAKVCVTNAVEKETCSSSKKLAEYFIKNGISQIEFISNTKKESSLPSPMLSITQAENYSLIKIGKQDLVTGRGSIISKNRIDVSLFSDLYMQMSYDAVIGGQGTNPGVMFSLNDQSFVDEPELSNPINWFSQRFFIGYSGVENPFKENKVKSTYHSVVKSSPGNSLGYLEIAKNSSQLYVEIKAYNFYAQLKN